MKRRRLALISSPSGAELKRVVFERAGATVLQTVAGANQNPTTENCLNWIAQGDSATTRTGNDVTLKCLKLKIGIGQSLSSAAGVPIENTQARIVVVLDTQPNRAAITPANVFTDTANAGNSTQAYRNWNYKDRYVILYDKRILCRSYSQCLGNSNVFYATRTRIPLEVNIDLEGIITKYIGGGAGSGVGSIITNAISLLAWSVPGDGTRPITTIDYVAELEYYDGM